MKLIGGGDIRLVVAMAGLVALAFLQDIPSALPPVDSHPGAHDFNAGRAIERLARVLGDETPHPADSPANDALRDRLIGEIEALGYAPQVRDDFTCWGKAKWRRIACARVRNVVFRAGPEISDETGKAVMLVAHYDSVPAGPGAADDGLGVAVSLEIAAMLAAAPPQKPVLFLLTDGEELGLLGAKSFVDSDPLADKVKSVVNVEARGVRGPGLMFQTSVPNGRDIHSYIKGAGRPFTNSMMTDIYRLLPNDSDVTQFLPKGYDAINMALTEGVEYYHTPHDNLANLDPRSVQHLGRGALRSLNNLLDKGDGAEEGQFAFLDILSRAVVIVPQWFSALFLGLGLIVAGFAFARAGGGRRLRALAAPPAIVVTAGAVAFALNWAIAALRPETAYWQAHPEALRAVIYLSAVVACIAGMKFVAAGASPARLLHSGWLWFSLLGAALFPVVPGAAILFAAPAAVYAASAVFSMRALTWTAWAPAVLAVVIFLPALHFAEIGLGLGAAPAFAGGAALLVIIVAPLALRSETRVGWAPVAAAIIAAAFATGSALIAPAYSAAKPLAMNIAYFVDADARAAQWLLASSDKSAPQPLRAVAPFEPADIDGVGKAMPAAHAPYLETTPPEVMVLADEPEGDGRRVRIALIANGADVVYLRIPEEAKPRRIASGPVGAAFGDPGKQTLYCAGRACNETVFDIYLGANEPFDWLAFGLRFGLPRAAQPLVEARPQWTAPIQNGDVSIIRKKIKI